MAKFTEIENRIIEKKNQWKRNLILWNGQQNW